MTEAVTRRRWSLIRPLGYLATVAAAATVLLALLATWGEAASRPGQEPSRQLAAPSRSHRPGRNPA